MDRPANRKDVSTAEEKSEEKVATKMTNASQQRVLDFAASRLEQILILGPVMSNEYLWRIKAAIKLLRNPPRKNRGMLG